MEQAHQAGARAAQTTRGLRLLLFAVVLASLAAGAAKLAQQRAHPPRFGTKRNNSYEGWVAIDGHATRAAEFRAWFAGEDPGAQRLARSLRQHHSSAIAIPPLVALLSFPLGSIPGAFVGLAGLAWLAEIVLVMRLARRVDTRGDPQCAAVAGILFAGHCLSARSVLQLLLDPFVALATLLALDASLRWLARRDLASCAVLLAVLLFGTFTKLSFLPVLALPAALLLLERRRGALAPAPALAPALALGLALGLALLPALALAGYLLAVGPQSSLSDVRQFSTSWSLAPERLRQFGLEMLLLVQAAPLLFLRPPAVRNAAWRACAVVVLLLLAPLLAFGLPAVPRLYLPVLGPGIALCAARFTELFAPRTRWWLLVSYSVLNLAVALLGLYLQASQAR